ncbi:F-box protein At5g49610-like [Mercurialis annua]|uniref:F-box protein At5g49610-like n=1 Tax=Mercurialis annua TaxID=3986 RepID=UPI0021603202|nr:F-box protein At5g49610-like [Mercurialis annua]
MEKWPHVVSIAGGVGMALIIGTVLTKTSWIRNKSIKQRNLPPEIISQILIRLPIKSLLRMKSVCKSWRYLLTEDRFFLENHISVHQFHNGELFINGETFKLLSARDGLLLTKSNVTSKYWIQNPVTKHRMILPDPRHKDHLYMHILYVASTNEYKLATAYKDKDENAGCEVFTLGRDFWWRTIRFRPQFTCMNTDEETISVVRTIGTLHSVRVDKNGPKEMISLDLETETFTRNALPQSLFSNWTKIWTLQWNDKLGFGHIDGEKGDFHVLVLRDYKNLKWDKQMVLPLADCLKIKPLFFQSFIPYLTIYGIFHFYLSHQRKVFVYKIASAEVLKIFSLPPGKSNILSGVSLLTLGGMISQVHRFGNNHIINYTVNPVMSSDQSN